MGAVGVPFKKITDLKILDCDFKIPKNKFRSLTKGRTSRALRFLMGAVEIPFRKITDLKTFDFDCRIPK